MPKTFKIEVSEEVEKMMKTLQTELGYSPRYIFLTEVRRLFDKHFPEEPLYVKIYKERLKRKQANPDNLIKLRQGYLAQLTDRQYYEQVLGGTYCIPPSAYANVPDGREELVFWYNYPDKSGYAECYDADTPKLAIKRHPFKSGIHINNPVDPTVYGDDSGLIATLDDEYID